MVSAPPRLQPHQQAQLWASFGLTWPSSGSRLLMRGEPLPSAWQVCLPGDLRAQPSLRAASSAQHGDALLARVWGD